MGLPNLDRCRTKVLNARSMAAAGKVVNVAGLTIEATGPVMRIGDLCYVQSRERSASIPVEVVGFRDGRILLMPLGDIGGIAPNSLLIPTYNPLRVHASEALLGRVLNSVGEPLDGGPPVTGGFPIPLTAAAPNPMHRERITEPIVTGVRAIDALITCGRGQRLGIMSGSGVGKSKLLGMVARNTSADVNVIALIGERGKEVRDFIEGDLGPAGLERSVVVVATSDEPALLRIKGAYLATALAEWFRNQGLHVMLMMDSVTRFGMAQREAGLAIGEPPTTKGYPPSVYAVLPKLLERAGNTSRGSITGMYNVLIEADDINDPIGDAVRSILDGHLVLSRDLASRAHYPAIDVLGSVSRVMHDVTGTDHRQLAQQIREVLAVYRDAEDLINIGAYVEGSNPEIDRARRLVPAIQGFLRQDLYESSGFDDLHAQMRQILAG